MLQVRPFRKDSPSFSPSDSEPSQALVDLNLSLARQEPALSFATAATGLKAMKVFSSQTRWRSWPT